jgi:hypothetical protein
MFEVLVMSANVVVESMQFFSESSAEVYASMMQDRGFKVRIV